MAASDNEAAAIQSQFGALGVDVDLRLGRAASDALLSWQEWIHRRVESVHLQEGERGRRCVSLDCTPPPDVGLADLPRERSAQGIARVRGQVRVPLALVGKSPMRHLDVRDECGRPVPVLGRRDNVDTALAMMTHLVGRQVGAVDPRVVDALRRVIEHAPYDAVPLAHELTERGYVDGLQVVDPARFEEEFKALVRGLSRTFILTGLIPASRAGVRQLIKYSFNWHIESIEMRPHQRLAVAAGLNLTRLKVPVPAATHAGSYHLEFHVPAELECVQLYLPDGSDSPGSADIDDSRNPVAHVHASYSRRPTDWDPPAADPPEAALIFQVPLAGPRLHATLAGAFTAVTFTLGCVLPGALEALLRSGDGAAAVLLAAPVILMTIAAGASESVVVSSVLTPLRAIMFGCAGLLTAGAASIVGDLRTPWIDILWWAGAAVSIVAVAPLIISILLESALTRAARRLFSGRRATMEAGGGA